MNYHVRALKNGECQVRVDVAFLDRIGRIETTPFYLYVWVIEGGDKTVLVDTGPKELAGFNQATQEYIPGGVHQTEDEYTPNLLRKAGVDPAKVDFVILTHLHYDHVAFVELVPNATVVINRKGFLDAFPNVCKDILAPLMSDWPKRLHLAEDEEEILPDLRVKWVGGHSTCSQATLVRTEKGVAAIAGDAAYLFANLEEDRPIGWAPEANTRRALEILRAHADFVLPGHDPLILERYPGGVVA
jgi:glyoxylase-like metal-dependent hydrolase (beta-lactamase superfamily II)